ncbi:MAG TPA: hypothetical protein VHC70_05125, partial [Phycisphaerales bacterium]|nr:hypothetical protein [Phycisphaerales bacterium]
MNKPRRFGWFGRSPRMDDRSVGSRRKNPARRLRAASGMSAGAMQVEELEQRQMLFSVTIGPGDVNPVTGVGTRSVDFAYIMPTFGQTGMPALNGTIPNPPAPTITTENFDDEMDPWTMANPPVPPSGTRFAGSNIQVAYQTQSGNAVELVPFPVQQGQQVDRALRLAMQTTDNVSFTFFDPQAQGQNLVPLVVNTASIIVSANTRGQPSDGDALKTDANTGTKVQLLSNGVVVQTISGAALAALGQTFGALTQYTFNGVANGFDTIRFLSAADAPNNSTYSDIFVVESIQVTVPAQTTWVSDHARGARLSFTGPAGATLQVFDLYGRDMQQIDCL